MTPGTGVSSDQTEDHRCTEGVSELRRVAYQDR